MLCHRVLSSHKTAIECYFRKDNDVVMQLAYSEGQTLHHKQNNLVNRVFDGMLCQ